MFEVYIIVSTLKNDVKKIFHLLTYLFQNTFCYCYCTIPIIFYHNDNTFLDLYVILFWLDYINTPQARC